MTTVSTEPSDRLDFHKEAESPRPKYEVIRDHLRSELTNARLLPGQPLPSEMTLVRDFNVARNTVRQAISELERDGLVRRVQGKGTFVSERSATAADTAKMNVFALVLPQTQGGHYPALLHGFEGAAAKVHNQVIISNTGNDVSRQGNIILQLLEKEVAGVAMVPATTPPTPAYQLALLQRQNIPLVFCHRRVEGIRGPLLALPYHEVGRMAGEAMVARGHRRVALLHPRRERAGEVYLDSLRRTLRDAGGDVPEEFVFFGKEMSPDPKRLENAYREALERMFSRPDCPTAILSGFDTMAELIYLLLGQMGLRMPEDVSLIGFGGTERRSAILSRLTSVAMDGAELGRRAAELLQEIRDGLRPADDEEEIYMPLGLSKGQTLGPAKKTLE